MTSLYRFRSTIHRCPFGRSPGVHIARAVIVLMDGTETRERGTRGLGVEAAVSSLAAAAASSRSDEGQLPLGSRSAQPPPLARFVLFLPQRVCTRSLFIRSFFCDSVCVYFLSELKWVQH